MPVISVETLRKIHGQYNVVVTPRGINAKAEVEALLAKCDIPYEIVHRIDEEMLHISGCLPNILYEYDPSGSHNAHRMKETAQMFQQMFERFGSLFQGKKVDAWVSSSDLIEDANKFMLTKGLKHILAYSTAYALEDMVIPIPDYRFVLIDGGASWDEMTKRFVLEGQKGWEDARAFWIGTVDSSLDRLRLHRLGERHKEKLHIVNATMSLGMPAQGRCPMIEWAKYKYLIDVRGYGWTDRLKAMFFLGRPLLLVDRPFKEYYFEEMKPMIHYVPVREDLTDLLEKIEYLDAHEDVYRAIAVNGVEFAKKHLTFDRALEYLRDVTLKYGVVAE